MTITNWRAGLYTLNVENFIDNISITPQVPNFVSSPLEISVATGGTVNFALDAGPTYAGKTYIILTGVTGTHPGFALSGINVPLNMDVWTFMAFDLINSPLMPGFLSSLDGSGQGSAAFNAYGTFPPSALYLTLYFDYLVLKGVSGPPVLFASYPAYTLFKP
jgi:hypothetical protein